eukprot:36077-Prymnesium_polylepis.1
MAAFVADHVSRNQTLLICARSPSSPRGAERGARCPAPHMFEEHETTLDETTLNNISPFAWEVGSQRGPTPRPDLAR